MQHPHKVKLIKDASFAFLEYKNNNGAFQDGSASFKKDDIVTVSGRSYKEFKSFFEVVEATDVLLKNNAVEKADYLDKKIKEEADQHQREVAVYKDTVSSLTKTIEEKDSKIKELEENIVALKLELAQVKPNENNDDLEQDEDIPAGPKKKGK